MSDNNERLRRQVELQAKRIKRSEEEQPTLLANTIYLGTLGLLLTLPMALGAYLGLWLDEKASAYSSRWTISLILIGLAIGIVNVYLFTRNRG